MIIADKALLFFNFHLCESCEAGFSLQRFVFLLENFSNIINPKTIIKAIRERPIALFGLPSIIQFSVIPVERLAIFNKLV